MKQFILCYCLGGFPLHGFSRIQKMERAIDMCRSFFTTLNGKQCILFSYTVFITKGSRETRVSKTEKTYFQVKHGISCQYVILRTTQSPTSHIFKGFKQYIQQRTAFWLLSIKLATASQKFGLGGNRNIHSQSQPNYNCFSWECRGQESFGCLG